MPIQTVTIRANERIGFLILCAVVSTLVVAQPLCQHIKFVVPETWRLAQDGDRILTQLSCQILRPCDLASITSHTP